MGDLRERMDGIARSIKPMITSKSDAPGYMFSATGKSFSKNCLTFDLKSQEKKRNQLHKILKYEAQGESQETDYDQHSQALDGFFTDCCVAHTDHKSNPKKNGKKKNDQSKNPNRKVEDPLAKIGGGNSQDDDRFLFYLESDMDKVRGTREISYMQKKALAPPVGAYSPKYNLIYPRIKALKPFSNNTLNNSASAPNIKAKLKSKQNSMFIPGQLHSSAIMADGGSSNYMLNLEAMGQEMFTDFGTKGRNLLDPVCTKNKCASRQGTRATSPFNSNNASFFHASKAKVNMDMQLSRHVSPVVRKNYVNVFDDCANRSELSDLVISPDAKKNNTVDFESYMGRNC